MSNLIGISGKIRSGKDTIGKIIQIITNYPKITTKRIVENLDKETSNNKYKIKKFADALKDCVCIIIGCTRLDLENQEFKDTPLGLEWGIFKDGEEYDLTPRDILQLLGTECGRNIIHPNIWINAAFADYIVQSKVHNHEDKEFSFNSYYCRCHTCYKQFSSKNKKAFMCKSCVEKQVDTYPNWIFTDNRFPNDLEAIKSRGGITIRVNRKSKNHLIFETKGISPHESEISLDNSEFDYVIDNNESIENLIIQVKDILISEKII